MYEIFLDTETTGLSFNDGHKVVEIACVETKDLIATGKIFHKILNPKRVMPEEAFKIHGFSDEYLKDKETFEEIADEFLDFIKDKKIIIHNAPFDLGFLDGELNALKKNKIKRESIIENLCFRPERNERSFPEFMELTPNEGIKGDRWLQSPWLKLSNGEPDPGIQVSILSTRVWNAVKFGPEAIHPGDTFMSDFDT